MEKDKRIYLMEKESVKKALIALSVPAIIGMLINAIYNAVDTMFVGKVGTEAIGAVTLVFPIFMLISTIGLTFGVGSASYISRLLGQKKKDKASQVASTAFFTTIIVGTIFTIIAMLNLESFVKMTGATETIYPYAYDYMKIIVAGSIFVMLNMTMNNILRAEGSAMHSMKSMVTGAVLNMILDPIFILVFKMGISGAAYATILSQIVTTIMLSTYIFTGKSVLSIGISKVSFAKDIYGEIIKIGIPTFIRQLATSFAMILLNKAAVSYGDGAVAAVGIANRVIVLGMYILFGFNQGFQPFAGFNYGAKTYGRLKESITVALKWTTIFSTMAAIVFIGFAEPIVSVFTKDPEVISIATTALRALSIFLPLLGFQVVYSGLFQALGKALPAGILALSRQGIFFIPALLILPNMFGLNGVLYSQAVADFFTVIVTAFFAFKVNREINKLLEDTESANYNLAV